MYIKEIDFVTFVNDFGVNYLCDFPSYERMSFFVLKNKVKNGMLKIQAMYNKVGLPLGYAIVTNFTVEGYLLVLYIAISNLCRSRGYGSKLIKLLKEKYCDVTGMIVEVDRCGYGKNEIENKIRRKRVDFYLKNQFKNTKVAINLFGADHMLYVLDIHGNYTLNDKEKVAQVERGFYYQIYPNNIKLVDKKYQYEFIDEGVEF